MEPNEDLLGADNAMRLEVEARLRAAIRILVIDNEVESADRAVMLLEREGYEAEIATDGPSALSLADRFQPHLIILGSIANRVNTSEFARLLRQSAHDIAPASRAEAEFVASLDASLLGGDGSGVEAGSGFSSDMNAPAAHLHSMTSSGPDVPILHLVDRAHLLQQRLQNLGSTTLLEAVFKPIDERELLDKVARALALKT